MIPTPKPVPPKKPWLCRLGLHKMRYTRDMEEGKLQLFSCERAGCFVGDIHINREWERP